MPELRPLLLFLLLFLLEINLGLVLWGKRSFLCVIWTTLFHLLVFLFCSEIVVVAVVVVVVVVVDNYLLKFDIFVSFKRLKCVLAMEFLFSG